MSGDGPHLLVILNAHRQDVLHDSWVTLVTEQHEAVCSCGQLRIRLNGPPALVSSCHCIACQRRTGALFGSTSFFAREQIAALEGESRQFKRKAESGSELTFHFCPTCGSTVHWDNSRMPDRVCVAVGAFADPQFPRPARTVWARTKHAWLAFPDDIPLHLENPR
jgi:hypothetical protein